MNFPEFSSVPMDHIPRSIRLPGSIPTFLGARKAPQNPKLLQDSLLTWQFQSLNGCFFLPLIQTTWYSWKHETAGIFPSVQRAFTFPFQAKPKSGSSSSTLLRPFYFSGKDLAVCFPQPAPNPFYPTSRWKPGRKTSPGQWKHLSIFGSIKTELHSLAGKKRNLLRREVVKMKYFLPWKTLFTREKLDTQSWRTQKHARMEEWGEKLFFLESQLCSSDSII